MDNFEQVSDAVRRHLEFRLNFERTRSITLSNAIVQMRLATRSNTFGILFECVWLLIQTCSAFCLNVIWLFVWTQFGFSSEPSWLFVRMHFIRWSNTSRVWSESVQTCSERAWTKMCYLACHRYWIWCSSIDQLDNFELFNDHQHYIFRLNFSVTSCTSLKIYSIENVTTAHAQSKQDCVQIIEGPYNQV